MLNGQGDTEMVPRVLICIGDAWVDPAEVMAVDAAFSEEDPAWANVRVTLRTGQPIYGMRTPSRVVQAVRRPEADAYDEESMREADGSEAESPADRARRRSGQGGGAGPRPIWPSGDHNDG